MNNKHTKSNIIKHVFSYTLSRYFAQVLNFFTATLMRRFLGPFFMGIWNLLRVVMDYSNYTDLGTPNVVFYKVPYLHGQNLNDEVDRLKNSIFNFLFVTTAISSILIFLYAVIFRKNLLPEVFTGLIAISLLLFVQKLYTYYIVLLRAYKNFNLLSASIIFDSFVNICLILLVVKNFKLYGLYAVAFILPLLNLLFIRLRANYQLKLDFKFPDILFHIKFGLPLYFTNILNGFLNSIDRIMIASMMGFEQLGFYTIALMAKGYGADISMNFSHVVAPYFFEDCGKKGTLEKSTNYVTMTTLVIAYFMTAILSMVFIWAPIFVKYVLPKFIPGISAMKLFLLPTLFSSISYYSIDYLVMLKRQIKIIPVIIVLILFNSSLIYIVIKSGLGITGVAACVGLSSCLLFVSILFNALKQSKTHGEILSYLSKVLFPVICSAIILLMMDRLLYFGNIFYDALIKSFILMLFFIPMMYILNRQTNIVSLILEALMSRIIKKKD